MNKDFETWNKLKQNLDKRTKLRTFNEREIWWVSVGLNVGCEVFGKDYAFTRPVLIIRKFSKTMFFAVPLTSNLEQRPYRYQFSFNGKQQNLLMEQMRTYDARRLANSMGQINEFEFKKIKQALKDLL